MSCYLLHNMYLCEYYGTELLHVQRVLYTLRADITVSP